MKDKDNYYIKIMKNDKDINSSLNNIKKALREEKDTISSDRENNDFSIRKCNRKKIPLV